MRLFASVLAALLLALPSGAQPDPVALTILHTNDTHGHLLPFRYPAQGLPAAPDLEGVPTGVEVGGIARRATLVRRIRAELDARGIPVWLVDAGDFTDGTAFSTEYQGRADLEAMGVAGYTLGTLGNHELNRSLSVLRDLLAHAPYPVVCANLVERTTGAPLTAPSLVRRVGPVRVGVFGLVTKAAAGYPAARDGLVVKDEIATARRVAAELRTRSDVVVLVSHAGKATDERIAATIPEIDVIIGGHSHSRLPSGELIWHEQTLSADAVGGTVVVQAHQWGGELGRLDLLFAQDAQSRWHVTRYRARLIPVTADIPEDPAVAAVVARYWKPIAARYGEVLGQASGDFVSRGDDLAEYNLMADAMRATLGTEVHLENLGGVRAPLNRGPITLGDLETLDPFDNTLVTFRVSGRDLLRILEKAQPAVSGLRYRIEAGKVTEAAVDGRPLDPDRMYAASTNSYFADKILGPPASIPWTDTGTKRRDALVAFVRGHGTVRPAYDGRRVIRE